MELPTFEMCTLCGNWRVQKITIVSPEFRYACNQTYQIWVGSTRYDRDFLGGSVSTQRAHFKDWKFHIFYGSSKSAQVWLRPGASCTQVAHRLHTSCMCTFGSSIKNMELPSFEMCTLCGNWRAQKITIVSRGSNPNRVSLRARAHACIAQT